MYPRISLTTLDTTNSTSHPSSPSTSATHSEPSKSDPPRAYTDVPAPSRSQVSTSSRAHNTTGAESGTGANPTCHQQPRQPLFRVDAVIQRDNSLDTPAIEARDRGILLAKLDISGPRDFVKSHAQADGDLKRLDCLCVCGQRVVQTGDPWYWRQSLPALVFVNREMMANPILSQDDAIRALA